MPKIYVKPVFAISESEKNSNLENILNEKPDIHIQNNKESTTCDDISFKDIWEGFREGSTLHGINHINFRYKYRGIIWSLALAAMICVLSVTLIQFKDTYFSYPTITDMTVDVAKELPFPAVTVCNLSPYNNLKLKSDPFLEEYFIKLSSVGIYYPHINFSDPNYAHLTHDGLDGFLQNNSFTLSDVFVVCVFKGNMISCPDHFKPKITSLGICYTFNGPNLAEPITTRHTGSISSLKMYMKIGQANYVSGENMAAGMKIVLHNPEEEPNVRDDGFLASPGFSTYAAVRMVKYKYLEYPYKSFGDSYCTHTKRSTFKNPLKYHKNYSVFACMKECKLAYIVNLCKCKMYHDEGDIRICSWEVYMNCYKPIRDFFDIDIEGQSNCSCPLPCEDTEYQTQISSGYFPSDLNIDLLSNLGFKNMRRDYLEVRVYYDSLKYTTVEQIPKYTSGDVVANLGGQLGIFIGASFLTLTEIAEFVVFSVYILIKRKFVKEARRN